MELTQIRYFLALAQALHFTRAAEACNVTQPALTKAIQRLEDELGGPLLLRERSHTQLTPLGDAMLPLLQQVANGAEAARTGAALFHGGDVARLRLGLGTWVEPATVTPLIHEVRQYVPGLELTIRHGDAKTLNEWLLSSAIDVALTAEADCLADRANRWPLFSDPVVVLLPQDHPLAANGGVTLEELGQHPLVGPPEEGATGIDVLHRMLPVRHRAETPAHVHAAVQAGFGLALSTARHHLPPGLVSRPLAPARHLDVVVAAMAGRPTARAAGAFLKLARARDWNG